MSVSNISSPLSVLQTTGHLSSYCKHLGQLFYLHDPVETSFKTLDQVPNFFRNAWPYFLLFILLENLVLWLEKRPTYRLNDGITSLSHGLIQECGRLVFRGTESALYVYIYNNYRIADLPWDSPITWYAALIGVDFCYYWVHRASHEVHLLWAQHQVHHSSEEYNLAVGLRQSTLQGWCSFLFYLPMALFVPPTHFLTHQQFNLMYQFWIHTKVVSTLGPLELVLNTPQHHRVHHGCNLYCIDKNYGGFLIIWDRIFGTFASERKKEDIVYGLVFNQPSFNPFFLQVFYNQNVIDKWKAQDGWKNKISAVIKGPSWAPGTPWTGVHEDKIDDFDLVKMGPFSLFALSNKEGIVQFGSQLTEKSVNQIEKTQVEYITSFFFEIRTREKYDVEIPPWCNLYLIAHFVLTVVGFQQLSFVYMSMSPFTVLVFTSHVILSLTTIGMLFDNRRHAALFEFCRCVLFILLSHRGSLQLSAPVEAFFISSAFVWILNSFDVLRLKPKIA